MTISSAIPVEIAELQNDPPIDEKYEEQLSQRALEDLVDLIMSGDSYPKHGRTHIDLHTILCEADASTVSDAIRSALFAPSKGAYDLYYGVEEIVKRYLEDSQWHEQRIEEMMGEE